MLLRSGKKTGEDSMADIPGWMKAWLEESRKEREEEKKRYEEEKK